jgi:hypothetical protein
MNIALLKADRKPTKLSKPIIIHLVEARDITP